MRPPKLVTAALVGYLIGTFPSADLAARRVSGGEIDLRTAGSGNPGGMNARRLLGRRAGTSVITADVAKGATAGLVGRLVAGRTGSHVAATAAVVGHCYPVWNGFRGGKGVATSAGQCLATFPVSVPITAAGAALTASSAGERRAMTATAASCVVWVVTALLWWRKRWPNLWGPRVTAALPVAALVSSAVVLGRFAVRPTDAPAGVQPRATATISSSR
ncbi:MAG: acyl phosphate:glycerol-3-phosphate acyltransferase [Acidimicrobiaceae bacterium]|nr:acyl phosphate:glycerol-3-phosphate acyltransferase [Acidimicrobiaceae bacterium]